MNIHSLIGCKAPGNPSIWLYGFRSRTPNFWNGNSSRS